jgi:hypothetical protein
VGGGEVGEEGGWGGRGGGGRGLAGLYGGRRETIALGKGKLCHLHKRAFQFCPETKFLVPDCGIYSRLRHRVVVMTPPRRPPASVDWSGPVRQPPARVDYIPQSGIKNLASSVCCNNLQES